MSERVKIKHSFATYRENGENVVNVDELANVLLAWGEIPSKLNDLRAQEISILAQAYLSLLNATKEPLK